MTPEQVERVAEILEQAAHELYVAGAGTSGRWDSQSMFDSYVECIELAIAARKMLERYRRAWDEEWADEQHQPCVFPLALK